VAGSQSAKAQILAIAAGAKCPELDVHSPGPEEVYVISGIFNDGAHDHRAGSFIHNPAGSALDDFTRAKGGVRWPSRA
jgi:hypothetical protein